MSKEVWQVGICKRCGEPVIEFSCISRVNPADYTNLCSNPKCYEFKFHHMYDMDEPEYYWPLDE